MAKNLLKTFRAEKIKACINKYIWIKIEPLIALPSLLVQLCEQSVLIFEDSFTSIWSDFEALQVTRHELKSHFFRLYF